MMCKDGANSADAANQNGIQADNLPGVEDVRVVKGGVLVWHK